MSFKVLIMSMSSKCHSHSIVKVKDVDNKGARPDLAHRERLWPFASAAKFGSDRQNLD